MTTPKIKKLYEALSVTTRAIADIESEKRAALAEEKRLIDARFAERLEAAKNANTLAYRALHDAQVEEAQKGHEWEGKTVYRDETTYSRWSSVPKSTKRIFGVVATYRPGVEISAQKKYNGAKIGDVIVLLKRKDGSVGLNYEKFYAYVNQSSQWSLVEEGAK